MIPADRPPALGYTCIHCEGAHFILPLSVVTITRHRAVSGTAYARLVDHFLTAQGRRELPRALADAYFDELPFLRGLQWARERSLGTELPNDPPSFTALTDGETVQRRRAAEAGIRDTAPQRRIPSSVAIPAPEDAPSVVLRTYTRRPETVQGFEVPESGWYNVPGVGVSVLAAGFYIFTENALQTRDPAMFERQFELVEEPAEVVVDDTSPVRFERDDVV